ncbi:MAG TPA: wax ester/triacylglycerol synthase family O-acyltransferase [Acidimicrobiales bacterium]|nr:wax ester/triacylglycerol synthase family O-acyltransferase [Acidimicrobiales bacterium]
MDRLSGLDAEFLHLEDGSVQMAIAGACMFADPPPTLDDLEELVAAKLHRIPRYRQRVRTVPLALGRPVWVDDPEFDLGYHIRHTALPAPGDDAMFCSLMGRIMSQQLDRDRPLWEMWLVEGVAGGRWAIIFKVHHCMVDGIAGVGLLTALLDPQPGAPVGAPEPWAPGPEPAGALKVLAAWGGLATDLASRARGLPGAVFHPASALRSGLDTTRGAMRFAGRLLPTPSLSIEGPVGPHRVWAHSSAGLDDVRTVRLAFGGTVNDVVLAAVAGGYRDLLIERGDDVDTAVVRSLVPVSTRREDGHGVADNRVSALLCELPVGIADPVGRLEAVQARMSALKASHIAEAGEAIAAATDLVPPLVLGIVSRATMRSMKRFGQQSLNTVTTNVPGPQFPLYCLGHEMLEYRPYVPISHGLRVGTAVLSYDGRLFFGITGDFRTTPDVGVVAAGAAAGIGELKELALERIGDHRPS